MLLHEAAALAVLQWVPAPGWAPAASKEQRTAVTLSAADALAAKQLLRSTVLGIVETVHAAPAATPPHAPLHTSLPFWALQPGGCGCCAVLQSMLTQWPGYCSLMSAPLYTLCMKRQG